MSLCKQALGVRKRTSNIKVLAELGRLPFQIYIETQMFKYLQRLPFLEENTYLRNTINEEIKIINSGLITNLLTTYILTSVNLYIKLLIPNLIYNTLFNDDSKS